MTDTNKTENRITDVPQIGATYKAGNGAIVRCLAVKNDVVQWKHISGPELEAKSNEGTMPLNQFSRDFNLYEKAA